MTPTCAKAQKEPPYRQGIIVTVTDDTISCLVPLVPNFGVAVLTKKYVDSRYDTIPVSKIKYLANGKQVYETVSFNTANGMRQELMWIKQEGTINLYETYYFDGANESYCVLNSYNRTELGEVWHYENGLHSSGPLIPIRVIRKNNQNYLLSDKYFQAVVGPLVADNPGIAAKLNSKKYTLETVEQLVEEYNEGGN